MPKTTKRISANATRMPPGRCPIRSEMSAMLTVPVAA